MSITLVSLPERYGFGLVNGRPLSNLDGPCIDVRNPANGELVARVPMATAADTAAAIDAAAIAQLAWKNQSAAERSRLLERWCGLINERAEEMALTSDHREKHS